MAPVGPQMPTLLSDKRKRADNKNDNDSESSSDSDAGPAPPGPAPSEDRASKKPRVIGPSLPPQPTDTQRPDRPPTHSSQESESSDDDDFGPSLPPASSAAAPNGTLPTVDDAQAHPPSTSTARVKRDDWMMVPPTGGDWTGRVDPTKLKNRKFNTGKSAKGPSPAGGVGTDTWHETPEEKQARLQREMMGIKDTSIQAHAPQQSGGAQVDAETAKRLREYNVSQAIVLGIFKANCARNLEVQRCTMRTRKVRRLSKTTTPAQEPSTEKKTSEQGCKSMPLSEGI